MLNIRPYRTSVKPYKSYTAIYKEMKEYIEKDQDGFSHWFVGITADHKRSLFVEHRVYENDDSYIFRECPNNRAAENVKASLLKLGCQGAWGGWINTPTIVYAYRRSYHTNP
jgi:hypothetical protein